MSKENVKTKNRKTKIIAAVAVAGVALLAAGVYASAAQNRAAAAMSDSQQIETAVLEKTSLTDYIAVSGTIYSGNSQDVYTTQSYPIKEVFVEVGDTVEAGDVLAVLDMSNLDRDIQQAEINLANSKKQASDSVQSVSNSIENAEMSVATSELNLSKAQLSYDTLKEKLESGTSTEIINARNSLDSAKQNLESAQRDLETKTKEYETNKVLLGVGGISQFELDTSLTALENAQTALETAQSNYDKALETCERTQKNLEADLITSEKDLESSKLSLQNAKNSLSQSRAKSGTVTSTVESQEITLLKLREQRSEAEIVAPISGTVTAVNATVGMTGSGASGGGSSGTALFVIDDMNDLYVSTSIKEFRIGEVAVGQDALVTTDATSDRTFKGYLSFIAPTATETSSTTNVEFEVNVTLSETDPDLRIGMNAYANIILEAREGIFAVSPDALVTGPGGESYVYAPVNGVVTEIPVITGMETDTAVEISGEGLREGMTIFLTPSDVTPGQEYAYESGQAGGTVRPEGQRGTRTLPDGADAGEPGQRRPDGASGGFTPPEGRGDFAPPERVGG